jgi:hypothetical protein
VKFSAEWFENPGDSTVPELSATACLLRIDVAGQNVTQLHDRARNSVRSHVVMPAYPLAEGLVKRWWWLIAGRTGSLNLRRHRDGYAVPDAVFSVDGAVVFVEAKSFAYENPAITFIHSAAERIDARIFEAEIRDFIEATITQLDARSVHDTLLQERWADILDSLSDPEERQFCEAAGALDVDPYTCREEEIAAITAAATYFSGDALQEFLAGHTPDQVGRDLDWLKDQVPASKNANLTSIERLRRQAVPEDAPSGREPAWLVGTNAARRLRTVLGITEDEVLADMNKLTDVFGANYNPVGRGRAPTLRACVQVDGDTQNIVISEFSSAPSRTFTFSRAIGDLLLFDPKFRSPVTTTQSYRQAAGRAFAAELLAPASSLASHIEDGDTIEDVAQRWGVSTKVVEHQLSNNPELSSVVAQLN